MRIDKQYESATVEPIGRQRVALIGALVVSSLVALTSLYDLISTVVRTLGSGMVITEISLDPDDLGTMVAANLPVAAQPLTPSYGEFALTGLSQGTLTMFAFAQAFTGIAVTTVALAIAFAALSALCGNASWRSLSSVVSSVGWVVLVMGGLGAIQLKLASDDASSQVRRVVDVWLEPGFLANISGTPFFVGLLILALGAIMRVAGRQADDNVGVI